MLADVANNPGIAQTNIASILRTVADYFYKETKLSNLMLKELGFCPERRIFKNSAAYQQSESNYKVEQQ